MGPKFRSVLCRTSGFAFVVLGLTQCGPNSSDQGSYVSAQRACMDGGETVTKGYHALVSSSSALKFKFDLTYDKCISTEQVTDPQTKKTCSLKIAYDGPLVYSYAYIPSGESYDFELSLESPKPLSFSINEAKHEIQFVNFKSIGDEKQKSYDGTIIVDGVEYAADKLIEFVENGMIFCP